MMWVVTNAEESLDRVSTLLHALAIPKFRIIVLFQFKQDVTFKFTYLNKRVGNSSRFLYHYIRSCLNRKTTIVYSIIL